MAEEVGFEPTGLSPYGFSATGGPAGAGKTFVVDIYVTKVVFCSVSMSLNCVSPSLEGAHA